MFDRTDEGKRVVTPDGTTLGTVDRVREGTAYVRPAPDVLAGFGPRVAGPWDDAYELDGETVVGVVADTVVLDPDDADAVLSPR